jgi:hypothetical protein
MTMTDLESTASPIAIDAGCNQHTLEPATDEAPVKSGFLHRLPGDLVCKLKEIPKRLHGGPFEVSVQKIFDEFLQPIEELVGLGAKHEQISQVLAELGLTTPDGGCLSRGTISKALSRARQEHAPETLRHGAADAGTKRPDPAHDGTKRAQAASSGTERHDPAIAGNTRPVAASSGTERQSPSATQAAQPPLLDGEKTDFARNANALLTALKHLD